MQDGENHTTSAVAVPNRSRKSNAYNANTSHRIQDHSGERTTPVQSALSEQPEGSPSKTRGDRRLTLASFAPWAQKTAQHTSSHQSTRPLPTDEPEKDGADISARAWPFNPRRLLWPTPDEKEIDPEKGIADGQSSPSKHSHHRASGMASSRASHKSQPSSSSDGMGQSESSSSVRSSILRPTPTRSAAAISHFRDLLKPPPHSSEWANIPISPARPPTADSSISSSTCPYPSIPDPEDLANRLSTKQIWFQRVLIWLIVGFLNGACVVAYVMSERHLWVLVLILFVKAKDVLSTLAAFAYLTSRKLRKSVGAAPEPVPSKQIMSMITCYNETDAQIMKTIDSIRENELEPHGQFICLILDGKPKDLIKRRMLRTGHTMRRPYITWQHKRNEVIIDCGYIDGTPIIYIEKVKNVGKKDSLVLGHDLFNFMRDDAPQYTKLLRQEIWSTMLPSLMSLPGPPRIDAIFCTDADSTIHKDAMRRLVEALSRDKKAIAACGILLAELGASEWTIWSLFQQFQYCYGQLVRRMAEGIWARVTCLPGCITMIAVRPEMANAIRDYVAPITDKTFFRHQVQYLGTDRRLTYSMLSQSKELKTVFVPDAVSETVVPQSLMHYLNQRRRWGSNAYFNDWFYFLGTSQYLITRLWALIDISRMTIVYVRQANNILFIYGLARNFNIIKIVPLLVVTQIPTLWFFSLVIFTQPLLRRRVHKIFLGLVTNYCISWCLSILVFTRIVMQLGSTAWGRTGTSTAPSNPMLYVSTPNNSLARQLSSIFSFARSSPASEDGHSSRHSRSSSQARRMSTSVVGSSRNSSVPPVPKKPQRSRDQPTSGGVGPSSWFTDALWNRSREWVLGDVHPVIEEQDLEDSYARPARPATVHEGVVQGSDTSSEKSGSNDSWRTA